MLIMKLMKLTLAKMVMTSWYLMRLILANMVKNSLKFARMILNKMVQNSWELVKLILAKMKLVIKLKNNRNSGKNYMQYID